MLKFNSFRSQRYLRTRFIEGTYLLASEGTDLELELIDFAREVVRKQVGDVAIGDAWKVVRDGQFSFIITPGEAWYDGLPFANRSAKDQLVSGDSLSLGIVPPLTTIADVATGEGKRVTLAATTTSAVYRVVITAEEKVITNIEDKFLKNANISEPTAQKLRLVYIVNVVPETSQITSPAPYKAHDSIDQNLVNEVTVNVAGSGSAGSQVSSNSVTGSEQIDGRDLEIIVVNVSGANLLPKTIAAQSAYAGGKLIDSIGSEYHIVSIINNPSDTSNQEIIRIDKEVGQSDPILSLNSSYRIVKRDVYSTDDVNGTPIGKRFWPIAKVDWEQTVGIVHSSAISDMRTVVEKGGAFQKTTHTKFDLRVADGGTVKAEPKDKATGNFTITNFANLAADTFNVNGVSFVEGTAFAAGGSNNTAALNLATAINNSPNPLLDGVVVATAVGAAVNITAVSGGTVGNSITLAYTDLGTVGATVNGPTLTGGVDGIVGQLTWSADFDIINPHSTVKFVVDSPGEAVLLDKGSLAYFLDYSALVDTIVSKGNLSVTRNGADPAGTTINFTGAPNLVNVGLGNTIRIHGTNESVSVTAIDDIANTIEVSSSVSGTGAATIYLDTYAPGTLPVSPETFVLAVKTGGIIQITGGAGLESGESTAGAGGLPTQLLTYIGTPSETDDTPNYSSTVVVGQGDSLTQAISDLDQGESDLATYVGSPDPNDTTPDYSSTFYISDGTDLTASIGALDTALDAAATIESQDRNAKLVGGGTWRWDSSNSLLYWSGSAQVQIPGFSDSSNNIVANTIPFFTAGKVLYVSLNRTAAPASLTPVLVDITAVPVDTSSFIFARRVGADILIGDSFLLKHNERLELDGALAEINRKTGQLKIRRHETITSKVRIDAADISQLDGSTLSQELSELALSFTGAVINFQTGAILKEDDIAALGVTFTPFSVPVGQYFWYGISLVPSTEDAVNRMVAQVQVLPASAANASAASAPLPPLSGDKKLGAVQVFNNAGSIEIFAIRGLGTGSGGSGTPGIIKVQLYDPISTTLPTGISPVIDGTTLLENDLVFFNNLAANNNRVYKATNVSVSVVWTIQKKFLNSSETPLSGDSIRVVKGNLFAGQIVYLDTAGNYLVNDTARYFSGNKGTNYWEQGSLKTATLADNTTLGTVFSVLSTNSENWVINYSVVRGSGNRETGQIYITSNGTTASSTTNSSYFGDTGTTFEAVISAPNLSLKYNTTNAGSDATMKFFVSRWSDSAGGVGGVPSYPSGGASTVASGAVSDVQYKGNDGNLAGNTKFQIDTTNSSLDLDGLLLSTLQGPITILDAQAVAATLTSIPYSYKWIVVEYSLIRDGNTQLGRLLIVNNNSVAVVSDDYVQTSSLGIAFTVAIVATDVVLKYTSTSTGFNASFKYNLRRWE